MCWIGLYPAGVNCDPGDLLNAVEVNDEGCGMAWLDDKGKLFRIRVMDGPMAVRMFGHIRKAWPDSPAVFHARLATTGTVCEDECHPIMTPDGRTAVFLNGTLDIPLEDGRTDTRTFAEDYLPLSQLYGGFGRDEMSRAAIEGMAQRTNAKILLMSDRPEWADPVMLFNRDQWIATPGGMLASNADHLGKGAGWDERTGTDGTLWRWRVRQPGQCHGCDKYGCPEQLLYPAMLPPAYRNETERRARVRP